MLRGRFYFRLTTSGNLLGEFSNQHSTRNQTHTVDRVTGELNNYEGEFNSVWLESDINPVYAKLKIWAKEGTVNIFKLKWTTVGSEPNYVGEGFIENGMLLGWYDFDTVS